jgi:hypothetical protein
MLGALAAIALVVGGISTTAVLTDENRGAAEDTRHAVVEVQTIQSADEAKTDSIGF